MKRRILNWVLKTLYCAVNPEEILTVRKSIDGSKILYLGGEQVGNQEALKLKEQAVYFEQSELWRVLTSTINEEARMRMFEQSKSDADMVFGKAQLYVTDIQNKLLKELKDFNG